MHGLRADTAHEVRVVASNAGGSWTGDPVAVTTAPLVSGFPSVDVTFTAEEATFDDQEVICTNGYIGSGYADPIYYCVDRWGEPRWMLNNPDAELLYAVRPLSDRGFAAVSKSRSLLVVQAEDGEITDEITPLWLEGKTRFEHTWIDMHEVIELRDGPWAGALAIITATAEQIAGSGTVLGGGLIVLDPDAGEVLWDWSAHGEPGDGVPIDDKLDYDRTATNVDLSDWLHLNALNHGLDEDGDSFFLLSLRYQDWVIKVDVETDEVVWRFGYEGDFELVDDIDAASPNPLPHRDWMYHQHAPEIIDHTGTRTEFVVFDNGNRRRLDDGTIDDTSQGYSRVVSFVLDEATMLAAPTFVVGSDDPSDERHFFSDYAGDADRLPAGDRLQYVDFATSNIVEVAYPGGDEVWRLTAGPSAGQYRVNYFPSLYETTWWLEQAGQTRGEGAEPTARYSSSASSSRRP